MKLTIKNKPILLGVALLFGILLCLFLQCILLIYTFRKETNDTSTTNALAVYASPLQADDAIYQLYECGEKIGIYDAKTGILIDIIHVFASSLPLSDQIALKKGISVFSISELAAIIEDFST